MFCNLCENPYPYMCAECQGIEYQLDEEVKAILEQPAECKRVNIASGEDCYVV